MYHLLETLLANTTTLVLVIVLGFVLLTLGADWLVDGASALAKRLIQELTDMFGFSSVSHLNRYVKNQLGVNPNEVRK